MLTIEITARAEAARHEQPRAAQRGLHWVARAGVPPLRGELGHDWHSCVRPEDVARSELFYSSTCCWV